MLTDFSSAGPTPFDLLLKPDIAAPGEAILSSIPLASTDYPGAFASWEGTSMAAPAVTGVVALMRERHPAWTPAQIRAALIGSAVPAYADSNATVEASPLRTGGGFVDAPGAVAPGVLSDPPLLGFGLLRPGASVTVPVSVSDAGDGAGVWQVTIDRHGGSPAGASAAAPPEIVIPRPAAVLLPVTLTVAADATEGDAAGYVVLTQGARIAAHPVLGARRAAAPRRRDGARCCTPASCAARRAASPTASSATATPPTPGRSACRCAGAAARRSTASTSPGARSTSGVTVEPLAGGGLRPFLMRGLDENRIAGESGLPIDVGPSLTDDPVPSAGLYWAPAGRLRRRGRLGTAPRRRLPPALLGQRRHAARARAPARLRRREDAARAGHRRGLGRRSALPRVRARAAGLVRPIAPAGPTGTRATASRRSASAGCRPGATRSPCARATTPSRAMRSRSPSARSTCARA